MFKRLAEVRAMGQGTITYEFENGAKQVCNINPQIFKDERGKSKDLNSVMSIFSSTAHDLGAKSFEI